MASSGVSVKGIADAASQLGLESFVGYFSLEQLQNIPLPCIIHWNQNHCKHSANPVFPPLKVLLSFA